MKRGAPSGISDFDIDGPVDIVPGLIPLSILLSLAAAVWGIYWLVLRSLDAMGLGPAWAVVLLNVIPLPIAIALACFYRQQLRGYAKASAVIGLCFGLGFAFYVVGLVFSSVIRVVLLFYLMPVWGTLFGIIWLHEDVSLRRWLAVLIGIAGLSLMLAPGGGTSAPINIGDILALLAGLLWALGSAFTKRFPTVPLHGTMTVQFLAATFVAVCFAISGQDGLSVPALDAWRRALPLATLYACLLILPSIYICVWCARRLAPGRVGLLMMSEVVVAVGSAAWFLPGERLGLIEWTGAGAIALAAVIETTTPTLHHQGSTPT